METGELTENVAERWKQLHLGDFVQFPDYVRQQIYHDTTSFYTVVVICFFNAYMGVSVITNLHE